MAQWLKVLVARFDVLGSVSESHIGEGFVRAGNTLSLEVLCVPIVK